jgi:hypothetical protein
VEAEYWSLSGWMTLATGSCLGSISGEHNIVLARDPESALAPIDGCHCQNLDVATTPEAIENSKITVNEFIG